MSPLSTPLDEFGAQRIRGRLITEAGGYLRNVIRTQRLTCDVCVCPISPAFVTCWRCRQDRLQFRDGLADLVVPICYAVNGQQSGHLMRMYKDQVTPDLRGRRLLTMLLLATLHFHQECLAAKLGHEFDRFATVPSSRMRSGTHPLRLVAKGVLRCPEIGLNSVPGTTPDLRVTDPERFAVPEPSSARRRHVLLIEDTWASGGHSQSAAAALKLAGAATVTILALARWINADEEPSTSFVRDRLDRSYDPAHCPL